MFACRQIFFHSKPQVHTKRSTLKSETSVPNVSKQPFLPIFFLWICYFVNVPVKKTHRGQVINAGFNLKVLLEPKLLSLQLYKWVKDDPRTVQLQIALTQGSNLRCRCNDNYEKNLLLVDHLPRWSKWTEQSQQRLLLLAPCPQAPWEMKPPFLLPHACSLMSSFWRVSLSLSQVWDWELSLVLVPAPYPSNKWLPLPAGAATGNPVCQGALFSPVCLSCILVIWKAFNMHCS